jgi:penicillin amidase
MVELLSGQAPIDRECIFRVQRDVFVRSSMELRAIILDRLSQCDMAASLGHEARKALEAISRWDGHYIQSSQGALAFEVCRAVLVAKLCEPQPLGGDIGAYASVAASENIARECIEQASTPHFASVVAAALLEAGKVLQLFRNWGGAHRLRIRHPFGFLPIIGKSFTYADLPAGGSSESLMKTAHGPVRGRHNVLFGSDARYVFDLSDPDENHFVLLGGQDGWIGSTTFLDQLALWQSGGYIKVPLRPEAARRNAAVTVELMPH